VDQRPLPRGPSLAPPLAPPRDTAHRGEGKTNIPLPACGEGLGEGPAEGLGEGAREGLGEGPPEKL
jgi:hypothetical protein